MCVSLSVVYFLMLRSETYFSFLSTFDLFILQWFSFFYLNIVLCVSDRVEVKPLPTQHD